MITKAKPEKIINTYLFIYLLITYFFSATNGSRLKPHGPCLPYRSREQSRLQEFSCPNTFLRPEPAK